MRSCVSTVRYKHPTPKHSNTTSGPLRVDTPTRVLPSLIDWREHEGELPWCAMPDHLVVDQSWSSFLLFWQTHLVLSLFRFGEQPQQRWVNCHLLGGWAIHQASILRTYWSSGNNQPVQGWKVEGHFDGNEGYRKHLAKCTTHWLRYQTKNFTNI